MKDSRLLGILLESLCPRLGIIELWRAGVLLGFLSDVLGHRNDRSRQVGSGISPSPCRPKSKEIPFGGFFQTDPLQPRM